MADTYTSILGLLQMAVGSHNNDWGGQLDSYIAGSLEKAIAGKNAISTTGGATNLATTTPPTGESSAIHMMQVVTGVLVSTATITVPNVQKLWMFQNKTTGSFGLLVKTASGTAINIPRGKPVWIMCDGSNGVFRADATDVGTIVDFGGTTAPTDTFECDGATKLIADYPDLYAAIGVTWGGNGTTNFVLPDCYTSGRFTRSRTASVTIGTYQAADTAAHSHTASGTATTTTTGTASTTGAHTHTTSASGTTASNGDHSHYEFDNSNAPTAEQASFPEGAPTVARPSGADYAMASRNGTASVGRTSTAGAHTHTVSTTGTAASNGDHTHTLTLSSSTSVSVTVNASSGTETRPVCAVVMKCIRY